MQVLVFYQIPLHREPDAPVKKVYLLDGI